MNSIWITETDNRQSLTDKYGRSPPLFPVYSKEKFHESCYIFFKPVQIFPSPVYPSLQAHSYVPGPMSVHDAEMWQSSLFEPHILPTNEYQ